jgi:DNA relaxase TraI-like protein/relaxase-like protein
VSARDARRRASPGEQRSPQVIRAGEHPDAQTLKAIEERFCAELGYSEHQRISVVHRDTDNLHIHVAINKIHSENLTIHDPKADYWIRSKLCAVLEHELGLARDRHNAKERHSRSNDMEAMSGEESFRGWLAQYAQHFLDATDWQDFHGIAGAYSVRLQIRANGFVFVDKESGVAAKASDVHRRLAKPALEARLGKFVDAETVKARAAQRAIARNRGLILKSSGASTPPSATRGVPCMRANTP